MLWLALRIGVALRRASAARDDLRTPRGVALDRERCRNRSQVTETAELLAIGDVATATGLAVTAVRYYDDIGVIAASTRVGGQRRFDPDTVGRVNFIKQAQQAGLSLEDIQVILDEERHGWQALLESKLAELTQRRTDLDAMIKMLVRFRDCRCQAVASCPGAIPP